MIEKKRPALEPYRLLMAGFMVALLFGVMSWLQGRFNSSDHDKAVALVSDYKPRGGKRALVDAILAEHRGLARDEISWNSEILSSCLGHVRVYANLPAKRGEPADSYAFDVDLTGPSVHPTDPRTILILKSLSSTASSTRAASR